MTLQEEWQKAGKKQLVELVNNCKSVIDQLESSNIDLQTSLKNSITNKERVKSRSTRKFNIVVALAQNPNFSDVEDMYKMAVRLENKLDEDLKAIYDKPEMEVVKPT